MKKASDSLTLIRNTLRQSIDITPDHASRFFKTNPGDYSAHDQFLGIRVPTLRKIAKDFLSIDQDSLGNLLQSPFNEERFFALIILIHHYKISSQKKDIYDFYMRNLASVNNWNLVDASAHLIIGDYLWDKDRNLLLELSRSQSLWERRISIVSTWFFIRKNDLEWTFLLADLLKNDSHDLIHKASGWMLREAGKKDLNQLLDFLNIHAKRLPRTMLRYAIEKLPKEQQKFYLKNI
jgi:3-methyladenine DNA glycosylase AlkD